MNISGVVAFVALLVVLLLLLLFAFPYLCARGCTCACVCARAWSVSALACVSLSLSVSVAVSVRASVYATASVYEPASVETHVSAWSVCLCAHPILRIQHTYASAWLYRIHTTSYKRIVFQLCPFFEHSGNRATK